MRKGMIALATILTVTLQDPRPAKAGIFATEITQLLNNAQLIMQYLRQAQQLTEAIKQTTDLARNSQNLTSQIFGPIVTDLNALGAIVQGGQLSRTLWQISTRSSKPASPATDIPAADTSRSIAPGRKPLWIPRWARFRPRVSRDNSFKVSSPCWTHSVPWHKQAMEGWKRCR